MAVVELSRAAVQDLERLIAVLSLPSNTRDRVRHSLTPLEEFPRLGPGLTDRWSGMRFLLGHWRWLLVVYEYDESADRVVVLTIQDARSSSAASSE